MRGKLMFVAGAAAGFVLGSRAGREKYDELVAAVRRLMDHPTVREAGGQVQAQATKLFDAGKQQLSNTKLADKLRHNSEEDDVALEDRRREQRMSSNSF